MRKLFVTLGCFTLAMSFLAPAAGAADISGQWNWVSQTDGGERSTAVTFKLTGEAVTGKWDDADVKGTFIGDRLSLSFPLTSREGGLSATLRIEGKLEGEALTGTWAFADYGGAFRATRMKAAGGAASVTAASVAGVWQCEIQADRVHQVKLIVTAEGDKLTGKINGEDREVAMLAPKFENGMLSFQVEADSSAFAFQLKPEGDRIAGTWKSVDKSGSVTGTRAGK